MDVIAELEQLERLKERQNWNAILSAKGLPVVSSREIAMVRVSDHPFLLTKVACYRRDPETERLYRHGEKIGWGYQARSKRTPKKPRCFHQQLLSEEWGGRVFRHCKDCGQWLNNGSEVVSLRAAKMIRANRQLWKDRKRTPVFHKSAYDGNGLTEGTEYTLNRFEFVRFPSRLERLFYFDRSEGWIERVAPEIEQRTLDAAWRYVLSSPDFYEYRAPYTKVREMRDAGFSIPQMARKLKVSERTINNRLADVPRTIARSDMLALRVSASGGYAVRTFWPSNGVDHIPRGSRASSLLEIPRRTEWTWLPVPLGRAIPYMSSEKPSRLVPRGFVPQGKPMLIPERFDPSQPVGLHDQPRSMRYFREKNRNDEASARQMFREYGRYIAPSRFCCPSTSKFLTGEELALDFSGRWWENFFLVNGRRRTYPKRS